MLLSTFDLTFACKTKTLGSLYSHALLIPTEKLIDSNSKKDQVLHEQKFKDLLSSTCKASDSTCQVSPESIVLD